MKPLAYCPENNNHKDFVVRHTVREDWILDQYGEYITVDDGQTEVMARDEIEEWTCAECGAFAKSVEEVTNGARRQQEQQSKEGSLEGKLKTFFGDDVPEPPF